ncbi:MAG: FAD-binding protein [Proteobacteria bacterium]|nr:FAD-binding protein [Pseudomonadota bacterium]
MTQPSESTSFGIVENWDRETDVVVAGYGGAGAVAAIEAHDAGADVLIVESTEQGGGNTLVSFGGFLCPTNVEDAVTYISGLFELSLSEKDDSLIRTFAEESVKNVEWVKSLRPDVEVHSYGGAGFPQVPGADSMKKYIVHGSEKGGNAFAKHLFGLLCHAVEETRGIPVMTRAPARRLVTNARGAVVGLVVEDQGNAVAVRARRAVILATGGYESDPRMLRNHVKGFPIHSLGHPGNRGDGVRMAQRVGAGLWHMNGVSCGFGLKVPEFESAFAMLFGHPAHVYVDRNGRRFVDETRIEGHAGLLAVDYYDAQALKYPRIPFYAIFDEALRSKGRISHMAGIGAAGAAYEWSRDNRDEIEKGWIIRAGTLGELARKIGVDPASLADTLDRWNRDARQGRDGQFGRSMNPDGPSACIESPPYYAVTMHPALINTQGGPRRDAEARVLDAFGEPIEGLYSAGELGSLWGLLYQGAGNIAECMVFGRIAGRNAAAETSRG